MSKPLMIRFQEFLTMDPAKAGRIPDFGSGEDGRKGKFRLFRALDEGQTIGIPEFKRWRHLR